MRARCPVPRDVGKLYETLNKVWDPLPRLSCRPTLTVGRENLSRTARAHLAVPRLACACRLGSSTARRSDFSLTSIPSRNEAIDDLDGAGGVAGCDTFRTKRRTAAAAAGKGHECTLSTQYGCRAAGATSVQTKGERERRAWR